MRLTAFVLAVAAIWQAEVRIAPEPRYFHFERTVTVDSGAGKAACAVLDAAVYAHSDALNDMRLYAGGAEVPYVLSTSQTEPMGDEAKVLDAGVKDGRVVFDLEMPARAYTDVKLDLGGSDFIATAQVTGLRDVTDRAGTALGSYTLFDLSGQRLGRSTTLHLTESTFAYLRVELALTGVAGKGFTADAAMVKGAEVPPSRQAQTLYTTVAETTYIVQRGKDSVALFDLPARVPVEQVSFAIDPADKTNFAREVKVRAEAKGRTDGPPVVEEMSDEILRVRIAEIGKQVDQESLEFAATLGANMTAPAKVEVAVENGDDRPLAIRAVRLAMRQRKVCFDVPGAPVTMFYGDAKLTAPVYDFARTFDPAAPVRVAALWGESANAAFALRPEEKKTLTEQHPQLLWVALLAVVAALGWVAFGAAKKV